MKTIYKYAIEIEDEQDVMLPHRARILAIQEQKGSVYLWAIVDMSNKDEVRKIALRGTGHDCENLDDCAYISTFQISGGNLVFHAFERKSSG